MSRVSCLVALTLSIVAAAASAQPTSAANAAQRGVRSPLPDFSLATVNGGRPEAPALLGTVDIGGAGVVTLARGRHEGLAPNDPFSHLLSISLRAAGGRVGVTDALLPYRLSGSSALADAISPLRLLAGAAVLLLLAWRRRHGRR